ncbi:MAG: zinc-ribbon domain-containing protein [Thermoplasmatales archaeon]|nr:zinc-ribbon domain-containing protein [Thermoplasmatales archaeon]
MGVCQNCGESLVGGALFCEKCGAKVGVAAAAAPVYHKPAWKKPSIKFGGFKPGKMMTVSIALVVAIIVLAGAMVAVVTPLMTEPKITQTTTVAEYVLSCAYVNYGDEKLDLYVAKTMIQNKGSVSVTDYNIYYKINGYTDWCPVHQYKEIVPGETVVDCYYPQLPSTVLDVPTLGKTVSLEVKWDYKSLSGKAYSDTTSYQLKILGRKGFVYSSLPASEMLSPSDYASNRDLLACFVTSDAVKEDAINATGGLFAGYTDDDAKAAFNNVFTYLHNKGVKYISPVNFAVPSSVSEAHTAQSLMYPKDVIANKGGTCIETSFCMAAMMESIGVSTVLFLIPGHVMPGIILPQTGSIYILEANWIGTDHTPAEANAQAVDTLSNAQWVLTVYVHTLQSSGIVPPE